MSPKTRTWITCVGLALSAAGSMCLAVAGSGCQNKTPGGHVNFEGCLGDCPPPAPTNPVPPAE